MTLGTAFASAGGLVGAHFWFGNRVAFGVECDGRTLRLVATAGSQQPRRMPAISRPMVPSRELKAFVPDQVQPRSAVLKALSQYVKEHNLQDPNKKTMVLCDEPLKSLFGVDTCTFLGMSKYVSPHLSKPEDVGGKYLEQAKAYEEAWVAENGMKPRAKRVAGKRSSKPTGLFRPVELSADLAKICGNRTEMPRQEIIKHVWAYIRLNNLQQGAGLPVRCDFLLRNVFHKDTVTAREIMGGIQPHIIKK